jgi:hypothetical protein
VLGGLLHPHSCTTKYSTQKSSLLMESVGLYRHETHNGNTTVSVQGRGECSLLTCNAMKFGESPVLRSNMSPPCTRYKKYVSSVFSTWLILPP